MQMSKMTIWRDWLNAAEARLTAAGALDARLDCEWMLCDALQIGRSALRSVLDQPADECALAMAEGWLSERERGLPLQYVQHCAYFMGHEFYVDERVLIPRQDTEILCEQAILCLRERGFASALDLCTGSGALAVSMALACPDVKVSASDISGAALEVARRNAQKLCADVAFFEGDLFDAPGDARFDMIVCNPPYISDADMRMLQREVRCEPELALRGGADGLNFYRRIAAEYQSHLNPGGMLLLEVGYDQAQSVANLLGQAAFIKKDLGGIERVVGIVCAQD